MADDGLNAGSSPEPLPGFALFISAGSFSRFIGDFYFGAIDIAFTTVSSITNGYLCFGPPALRFALVPRAGCGRRKCFVKN
jgi:hypothetical protein